VRLGVGEFEDSFMVEIDLGTERRGQLIRQHHAYQEFFRSGVEQAKTGVFPGVLWIVPDQKRSELLGDIHGRLPEQTRRLFTVATSEQALGVLCGETIDADAATGGSS
jgi:protein involved in plasmid replication-relaxation